MHCSLQLSGLDTMFHPYCQNDSVKSDWREMTHKCRALNLSIMAFHYYYFIEYCTVRFPWNMIRCNWKLVKSLILHKTEFEDFRRKHNGSLKTQDNTHCRGMPQKQTYTREYLTCAPNKSSWTPGGRNGGSLVRCTVSREKRPLADSSDLKLSFTWFLFPDVS